MSDQREIGIFDAKTRLSELISEVEAGASMTLTRRGRPVARLVPVPRLPERSHALKRLKALGAEVRAITGGIAADEISEWRKRDAVNARRRRVDPANCISC